MKLTKDQRESIYQMFGGKCAYCGCDLPEKKWHADHIEAVYREWWKVGRSKYTHKFVEGKLITTEEKQVAGFMYPENDRLDNLFPACIPCNIDKSVESLENWRTSLERKIQVLRNNSSAWRHAERFGLVGVVKEKVVFYFETFGVKS